MNDRAKPSAPAKSLDERSVEIERTGELEYWMKVFNTSQDELLAAISEVGTSAAAVAMFFNSRDGADRTP